MKKVWRIYKKVSKKKHEVLNNHYVGIGMCDSSYTEKIPVYKFDNWKPEENETVIPEFTTQEEAIDFMIKYLIEGFVALTIEKK
jgi:hypothetical protein